jgi:hypothetical protein
VQASLHEKCAKIALAASAFGLVSPPSHSHFIGLSFPPLPPNTDGSAASTTTTTAATPEDGTLQMCKVNQLLKSWGVFCNVRSGRLRVAPHMYTTDEEMDKFLSLLETAVLQSKAT